MVQSCGLYSLAPYMLARNSYLDFKPPSKFYKIYWCTSGPLLKGLLTQAGDNSTEP